MAPTTRKRNSAPYQTIWVLEIIFSSRDFCTSWPEKCTKFSCGLEQHTVLEAVQEVVPATFLWGPKFLRPPLIYRYQLLIITLEKGGSFCWLFPLGARLTASPIGLPNTFIWEADTGLILRTFGDKVPFLRFLGDVVPWYSHFGFGLLSC